MITISEAAQSHFAKLLADQAEGTNIRVFVVNPGTTQAECGVSYCPADAVEETDIKLPFNGFDAVVDEESAPFLEEADIDFAVGTSAKSRLGRRYSYSANQLSAQLQDKPQHFRRIAIVFGCEEAGLSNQELDCCDLLSYVPIANSYPSLNLGQAVMIYAYSLTALTQVQNIAPAPTQQWSNLKSRSAEFLKFLDYDRHSKLYRWAMERLATADSNDINFLHLLLNRLSKKQSKQ